MQNLQGTQADRDSYLDADKGVTPEGSRKYADLYMSGEAPGEDGRPKGIPAEDFHNFATEVFLLKDNHDEFTAKRAAGETITQLDFGSGPNIYNVIAGLAEMDKTVSVELAPSNIQTLNSYKDTSQELPAYWNAWLDLGVLLRDLGSADELLALDKEVKVDGLNLANEPYLSPDSEGRINLYDSLLKWPLLSEDTRDIISDQIYMESDTLPDFDNNPYRDIQGEGLQNVLARKWTVRQGDLYNPLGDDRVPSIADLAGTAHFNTATFVTESTTAQLPKVLHAEAQKVQFSKPDGFWVSSHIAKTTGYNGFLTEGQMEENPDLEHEECPMSRNLIQAAMGKIVKQDDRYSPLSSGEVAEHRRMVRPGKQYSEAVIVSGRVDYLNQQGEVKYNSGIEFMNEIRPMVLKVRHVGHYVLGPDSGEAILDLREKVLQLVDNLRPLGNDSANWNGLNQRFWNKYSKVNYDVPIPGDIEGMFHFIENMREQKGGTYLDVGTGSAPQFAIAAAVAGMDKIIVSDHADGALKWLNNELLGEQPLSDRSQMWLDIAKLLSTFKDKNDLLAYCHETGFDKKLRKWQTLNEEDKAILFNDRRDIVERGQGAALGDSFLDNDIDIKAKLRQMHEDGRFEIRKFSILNPPDDLIGQVDLVTENSVASCMSEKASEYCQTLINVCRLARPETGIVSSSYTPYDNWKEYTEEAGELPSLPRHNYYYSVAHSLLLRNGEIDGTGYDRGAIAKEAAIVERTKWANGFVFEGEGVSLRAVGDNRFEHLIHISGLPQGQQFQNAEEMLAQFQVHMLGRAESFLLEHPHRQKIVVDQELFDSVGELEVQLGMQKQHMTLPESRSERREQLANRIENIINYLDEKRQDGTRDVSLMDKQDAAISNLVDGIYERLVGRSNAMDTNVTAQAASR